MIWRVPPMSALAWPLAAGHMLRVTDIEGGQTLSLQVETP
jgi:uncharacterized protein YcgI (DUF1989 family)